MYSKNLNLLAPWETVKERLKENNLDLTDADLEYEPGREDDLLEKLQRKLKKPKAEIRMLIESISSNTEAAG